MNAEGEYPSKQRLIRADDGRSDIPIRTKASRAENIASLVRKGYVVDHVSGNTYELEAVTS